MMGPALAAGLFLAGPGTVVAADSEAAQRGEYVFNAADCLSCHTNEKGGGKPLAGGRPLATPFGTFNSPNITPDPETGIGKWSADDLKRALRHGRGPAGEAYFPVFPFPSFTRMSDGDIADLHAYLMTREKVVQQNKPHDVKFPFSFRVLNRIWDLLFLQDGPLQSVAGQSAEWNRGRYVVEALAHCGECHSPRGRLGAVDHDRALSGVRGGPEGMNAPNITPNRDTGIGAWSIEDITTLLKDGQTPDFDFVGSGMAEVVKFSTSKLTDDDRRAIAVYLKSLPARPGPAKEKK